MGFYHDGAGTSKIVGGGLSGLYAARLLAAAGRISVCSKRRGRLGGRILSVAGDGFDLGPAWFWPDMQPVMTALVEELGLTAFAQYAEGDVLIERSAQEPVQRFAGFGQMASSFRIAGGTAALVSALAAGFATRQKSGWAFRSRRPNYGRRTWRCERVTPMAKEDLLVATRVLFALPPRLLESSVAFTPAPATRALWRATPTWMAPHAKFLAVYDQPFWGAGRGSAARHRARWGRW